MTWQDIPGWYDWPETYREVIHRFPNGSTLVEVGCYLGRSLCHLATLAKEAGRKYRIVGVDTCRGSGIENGYDNHAAVVQEGEGSFAGRLHSNIVRCGLGDDIELIVSDSEKAAKFFPIGSVEFVFLDAAHDLNSVRRDIVVWQEVVKKGGVLAGDDYGIPGEPDPVWPGVKQAVDELLPGREFRPHDAWWYEVR